MDYRNESFSTPKLDDNQRARVEAKLALLKRKGVYPYEYMDSFERFHETALPPKEAFFSSLKGEGISDEDYASRKDFGRMASPKYPTCSFCPFCPIPNMVFALFDKVTCDWVTHFKWFA